MTAQSATINAADDLEARAEAHLRARLASSSLEVPLLPEVAAIVIAESEESFDFRKVSEQIHRDQALAGHVLRIANSAAICGRSARIVSLQQALVRLGTRRVKELILAVVMKTRVFRASQHAARAHDIWREAAASAFIGREIARVMRKNPESAFLAGLLHTIGKPVVLQVLSEMERRESISLPKSLFDKILDEHHPVAGRRLVASWALPDNIAVTIGYHKNYNEAPVHKPLVTIIAAAGQIAKGFLREESDEELQKCPIFEDLHLYPEDIQAVFEKREEIVAYVEAFS